MTDIYPDKIVLKLIDHLIKSGVGVAQNGLIHSLAIWLDSNLQGEVAKVRKEDACARFSKYVYDFVEQKNFERRTGNKNLELPSLKNEWQAIEEISNKVLEQTNEMSFEKGLEFIAYVYAAWILSCPASVMKNSPQYEDSISTETESELIGLMFRYLDIYMTI